MKIVAATVGDNPLADRDAPYVATVTILTDGERYSASGEGRNPTQAVNEAYGRACSEVVEKVRKTLKVGLSVTF